MPAVDEGGAATVSVFAGQLYVGSGYRRMSGAIEDALNTPIIIEVSPERPYTGNPMTIR